LNHRLRGLAFVFWIFTRVDKRRVNH